jgi:Xaa-Pro dipeptidase
MSDYAARQGRIYDWMAAEGIALVMLEDFEHRRDPGVRWLTGQPGDALLFLSAEKKSLLVPWDMNMALIFAQADAKIPYTEFDRSPFLTLKQAAEYLNIPPGARIEIPPSTSYPRFLKFIEELSPFDILCRENGAAAEIEKARALKDEDEITIYRKVSALTNEMIDKLEQLVREGALKTESDVALFIEAECRRQGCEGTGFDTLAAGKDRSFGIHAFPNYTAEEFAGPGLSILDFGLQYAGYTSDVTLTFARGPLSKAQERQINLVEKAYDLALSLARPQAPVRSIALEVEAFFARARRAMPHGLGHGIGLEAHEAPALRTGADNPWILQPGMIITLEPGLYDPVLGGCRLENDVLITGEGHEVLTKSRIIRL